MHPFVVIYPQEIGTSINTYLSGADNPGGTDTPAEVPSSSHVLMTDGRVGWLCWFVYKLLLLWSSDIIQTS